MGEASNATRTLWTVLGFTLVGPFLAALAIVACIVLASLLKLEALLPSTLPPTGTAGIQSFVWSAIPAAIAALGLSPMVWKRGTFGPIEAAAACVIAFAIANALAPVAYPELLPGLAFLAGVTGLILRFALIGAGILRS